MSAEILLKQDHHQEQTTNQSRLMSKEESSIHSQQRVFHTTCWSAILEAGDPSSEDSEMALTRLCQAYWYPLYAYVRSRGFSAHDAQDITQEFFATFIQRNYFAKADQTRGKFRTFLLTSLKNYICDFLDKKNTLKRGGDVVQVSWDNDAAETKFNALAPVNHDPDWIFDHEWAQAILERVVEKLRKDVSRSGDTSFFDQFKTYVWGENSGTPIKEIAKQFNMSEGAVKVAMHRLRSKFRDYLRAEIAETTESKEDLESELRYLVRVLTR
jgi:RNA polymerase sigma-70 factor (ECF subfamily)